jgi:hypothetical protein
MGKGKTIELNTENFFVEYEARLGRGHEFADDSMTIIRGIFLAAIFA